MKKRYVLVSLIAVAALLLTTACGVKPIAGAKTQECGVGPLADESAMVEGSMESAAASMMDEDLAAQAALMTMQAEHRALAEQFMNENIYFPYDAATLSSAAIQILDAKVAFMKKYDDDVLIAGHCDERGSIEYNLALGQRRADAAKRYLVDRGIAPSRISTISYGKERPLVAGHTEAAWAKNRADVFTLQ